VSDNNSNSTLTRNVFAVIGLIYVVAKGIKAFNDHVKEPLEKKLTEVFDDEAEATARWRESQRTRWNGDIDSVAKQVGERVATKVSDPAAAAEAEAAVRDLGTLAR
jgi:hypothetical protein